MVAMIAYAVATGASLRLTWRQHGLAIVYGIAQYALNYYAVYLAERSVTSGLIAVVFALLIVPNALLAWVFLRQRMHDLVRKQQRHTQHRDKPEPSRNDRDMP